MKFALKRLKIFHKLLLSSVIFVFPIALLLYFMVMGINYDIHFSRKEIWGNRVLQPLQQLLVLIPRHQLLLMLGAAGEQAALNEMASIEKQIELAFTELEQLTSELGTQLQIDRQGIQAAGMEHLDPFTLSARWQALQNPPQRLTASELQQQHDQLTQNIYGLIRRVGDTSNLILDPDLDSYYMMDIVLLAMPQMLNRVGDILFFGGKAGLREEPLAKEHLQFGIFAAMLQEADLERILQGAATSLREDANFYGELPSLQRQIPPAVEQFTHTTQPFLDLLTSLAQSGSARRPDQAFLEQGNQTLSAGTALWKQASNELTALLEIRITYYQQTRLTYLLISLAALVIAGIIVLLISRGMTSRLKKVIGVTAEVAQGNLVTSMPVSSTQDEVGALMAAIDVMIQNLNALIRQMQQSGIRISSSTTELSVSARQQEAIIHTQVESTHHVLELVQQISQVIEELVHTMERVTAMSQETADFANEGRTDLSRLEEVMQQMEQASKAISGRLEAINEKAENITSVVTTITNVADQTNLLSLNAAIEAEKAGEYGRGFTVVAREIRRLADQTAVSTLDIEQMVKEMQSAVAAGVMEMDKFIADVRKSVTDVSSISSQLSRIIEQVQSLTPSFDEVNQGMQQQSESAQNIKQAMLHLNEEMQQTSDSLQETYGAIEQLNEAAEGLKEEVSRFQV